MKKHFFSKLCTHHKVDPNLFVTPSQSANAARDEATAAVMAASHGSSIENALLSQIPPQSIKIAAHPRNTLGLFGGSAHMHQCNTFRIHQNLCVCML